MSTSFKIIGELSTTLEGLIAQQEEGRMGFARTTWIYGKEAHVFVRATKRVLPQNNGENAMVFTLDLASIDVMEKYQNKGVFRQVLQEVERVAALHGRSVYVESILNDILEQALPRYGYHLLPHSLPPAFYKSSSELQQALNHNQSDQSKRSMSSRSSFK